MDEILVRVVKTNKRFAIFEYSLLLSWYQADSMPGLADTRASMT
jgi:hypothetical protein